MWLTVLPAVHLPGPGRFILDQKLPVPWAFLGAFFFFSVTVKTQNKFPLEFLLTLHCILLWHRGMESQLSVLFCYQHFREYEVMGSNF